MLSWWELDVSETNSVSIFLLQGRKKGQRRAQKRAEKMVAKRMHCGSEQLVAGTSIHSLTHERENELVIKRMSATECVFSDKAWI